MTTKEKLIEVLEKLGWKSKESVSGDIIVSKEIKPFAGNVTQIDLPSTGCTFICFELKTNIMTYSIWKNEFDYVLGYLTVLPFENGN